MCSIRPALRAQLRTGLARGHEASLSRGLIAQEADANLKTAEHPAFRTPCRISTPSSCDIPQLQGDCICAAQEPMSSSAWPAVTTTTPAALTSVMTTARRIWRPRGKGPEWVTHSRASSAATTTATTTVTTTKPRTSILKKRNVLGLRLGTQRTHSRRQRAWHARRRIWDRLRTLEEDLVAARWHTPTSACDWRASASASMPAPTPTLASPPAPARARPSASTSARVRFDDRKEIFEISPRHRI